jgi:hypothetical protein
VSRQNRALIPNADIVQGRGSSKGSATNRPSRAT